MILSEKSTKIIDACRFCWMCRHICPIGNATGQERNTSRARAMSLSMVLRGGAELTSDIIDNVYECALCGACTKDCATGWDPVAFTKEARLQIALEEKTPAYINKMLKNLESIMNVYGIQDVEEALQYEISSLPRQADVLLFLGQDARYKVPHLAIQAIRLLKKADVSFTVLSGEPDSGYALDTLVGAAEETRQTMSETGKILSKFKTIIAFDPADAKVFLREYKEWNIPLTAEVITFTAYIEKLIKRGNIKLIKSGKTAVLQDSAHLSRDLDESEPFRTIANAVANVTEILLNRKDTMWAGNLIMNEYLPDVMTAVAAERWKSAKATGAETLITVSPSEYAILKKAKPDSMELISLEELLLQSLDE